MAGNDAIHLLRGDGVDETTTLNAGQPYYNAEKNYLTIGNVKDDNGEKAINSLPIVTPAIVAYPGDTVGNDGTSGAITRKGSNSARYIRFSGSDFLMNASLVPSASRNFDLGRVSARFKKIYSVDVDAETLNLTSNAIVGGTLNVTEATTLKSTLTTAGKITAGSGLEVTGNTTTGTLNAGATNLSSTLNVTNGKTTLKSLEVTDNNLGTSTSATFKGIKTTQTSYLSSIESVNHDNIGSSANYFNALHIKSIVRAGSSNEKLSIKGGAFGVNISSTSTDNSDNITLTSSNITLTSDNITLDNIHLKDKMTVSVSLNNNVAVSITNQLDLLSGGGVNTYTAGAHSINCLDSKDSIKGRLYFANLTERPWVLHIGNVNTQGTLNPKHSFTENCYATSTVNESSITTISDGSAHTVYALSYGDAVLGQIHVNALRNNNIVFDTSILVIATTTPTTWEIPYRSSTGDTKTIELVYTVEDNKTVTITGSGAGINHDDWDGKTWKASFINILETYQ